MKRIIFFLTCAICVISQGSEKTRKEVPTRLNDSSGSHSTATSVILGDPVQEAKKILYSSLLQSITYLFAGNRLIFFTVIAGLFSPIRNGISAIFLKYLKAASQSDLEALRVDIRTILDRLTHAGDNLINVKDRLGVVQENSTGTSENIALTRNEIKELSTTLSKVNELIQETDTKIGTTNEKIEEVFKRIDALSQNLIEVAQGQKAEQHVLEELKTKIENFAQWVNHEKEKLDSIDQSLSEIKGHDVEIKDGIVNNANQLRQVGQEYNAILNHLQGLAPQIARIDNWVVHQQSQQTAQNGITQPNENGTGN